MLRSMALLAPLYKVMKLAQRETAPNPKIALVDGATMESVRMILKPTRTSAASITRSLQKQHTMEKVVHMPMKRSLVQPVDALSLWIVWVLGQRMYSANITVTTQTNAARPTKSFSRRLRMVTGVLTHTTMCPARRVVVHSL